jgi:hypothetical protein
VIVALGVANNVVGKQAQSLLGRGFKAWCENTALGVRMKLGLDAYDALDPYQVAQRLHIAVWSLDQVDSLPDDTFNHLQSPAGEEWSAVTVSHGDSHVVVINPSHTAGRKSSDLMHELAHVILNHAIGQSFFADSLMIREYDEKQEAEADWLAGTLLLPRKALEYIKRSRMAEGDVLSAYVVSSQLYNYRCRMTAINRQYIR